MGIFTYFDSIGRIVCRYTGSSPETTDADYPEWQRVEGDFLSDQHYLLDGMPTPRPPSPVVRDGLRLSAIQTGAVLHIDGVAYPIPEGGSVELDFPLPGTYLIRVECFPFLDFTDEVTV